MTHRLIIVLLPYFLAAKCQSCAESRLILNEITSRQSGGDGFNLRFCCGVDRLWIAPFDGEWQLNTDQIEYSVDKLAAAGLADRMQYATCADGKTISGQVHGETDCKEQEGAAVALIQYNQQLPFELDKWYTICYRYTDGCSICFINVFCANVYDTNCENIWLKSSIADVANDSLTLNVHMGRSFPLNGDLKVVLYENRLNEPAVEVERSISQARPLSSLKFASRKPLKANTYYVFHICVETIPTSQFRSEYGVHFGRAPQVICKNDTAKTIGGEFLGTRRSSHGATILTPTFVIVAAFAIMLL